MTVNERHWRNKANKLLAERDQLRKERDAAVRKYDEFFAATEKGARNMGVALSESIEEVEQLEQQRDALVVERDKDYTGMREFQAKFIAADQEREKLAAEVARLREEVYALQADMNPEDVGRVMRALDAARKQG